MLNAKSTTEQFTEVPGNQALIFKISLQKFWYKFSDFGQYASGDSLPVANGSLCTMAE